MISEKINKFLLEKGYRFEEPNRLDSDWTVAKYYRLDRNLQVPFCLLNDKQPQFCIRESFKAPDDHLPMGYHAFSIHICNQAPQGWLKFEFYSLDEKDVLESLDHLESALLEAWSTLFIEK